MTGTGDVRSTAYRHWDQQWRDAGVRVAWSRPEAWVAETVPLLRRRGVRRVLDLGCGVGRHALFLAGEGFSCVGLDRSEAGIAHAQAAARAHRLQVDYLVGGLDGLPFPSASIDYVLAWNVVYHGDEPTASAAIAEITRVLRPGGLYQATMLSKRDAGYGAGVEISPNTFVQPEASDDKTHPHLYCDAHDVLRLHPGLDLLTAFDQEQKTPGSFHWNVLFETPETPSHG